MSLNTTISLAQNFMRDFAQRYDMPELAAQVQFDERYGVLSCTVEVQPRGQMAALVRMLSVGIRVSQAESLMFSASVRMSYQHHGGGTNGHSDNYRIVTKTHVFKEGKPVEYVGFISYDMEHAMMIERDAAERNLVDQEKEL